MKNIKTIFFDYDGTLHDSMKIYMPAFLKAYEYLVQNHLAPKRNWSASDIKIFLGQNPKEMWEMFEPKLNAETIQKVSQIISNSMKEDIELNQAVLYDGSLEVLQYLKSKGYRLVYLSNSKTYYMEAHQKSFNLSRYFDMMVCSEMFDFIPKKIILEQIKKDFPGDMVIIGDRIHDMESGYFNNVHTIACDYGYGSKEELKDAELHIQDIRDLMNIL
jgi:phosphoglycolate phosphatase